MVCTTCGGRMEGDGYTKVFHCETLDLIHSGHEPDADPVYCQEQNPDTCSTLDEPAWRAVCETAAKHAQNGCGCSYDWYVELFSSAIDAQVKKLPDAQHAQALLIATQEWSYATPAERQETRDSNARDGYCLHGIDKNCCPAGCGDYDDYDDDGHDDDHYASLHDALESYAEAEAADAADADATMAATAATAVATTAVGRLAQVWRGVCRVFLQ